MDEMRLISVTYIAALMTKYKPYAHEHPLEHVANVVINEINALAGAPEPICFQFLMFGRDINEATRFFSTAIRNDELDGEADVMESGGLARKLPTEAQKAEVLRQLAATLDETSLAALGSIKDPTYTGSYQTCLAMKMLYQHTLSMPEPDKEIALWALLGRR